MNRPGNEKRDQALFNLVSEYESISKRGLTVFLEEKAYVQLIDYYEEEEQFEKALEVTDRAIEHYGFSTDFYLRKAQLLLQTNREEMALIVLDQAAVYSPLDLDISLLRAEALTYLHRFSEALGELEVFRQEAEVEDLSDIYLIESLVYEQQEEYEHMFLSLKSALECNPRNQEALERIWLCTEYCKKHQESVTLHQWVIDEDPYSYQAWHNLGHAQAYLGNYTEAIEAYEYAFLINENFEEAYYNFADTCFEIKQFERALDCYREIAERFEKDSELQLRIGQCYLEMSQPAPARKEFEAAVRLDPHNDEIFYFIGECYAAEERWKQACRYFQKAIRLQDEQEDYHAALAEAAYQLSDYKLAENSFRTAIRLAPENSRLWLDMAWFYLEINQPAQAIDLLEEAEEHTTDPEITYGRIACLLAGGMRQEALQQLALALMDEYEAHNWLFEWMPELSADGDVMSLIATYRP